MLLSPPPIQKFFDNNGEPMAGGLLFTYIAGTSTKVTTYKDSEGSEQNTNPIDLDFRGECEIWIEQGSFYKFVLSPPGDTDPPTNAIRTVDNISVAGGGEAFQGSYIIGYGTPGEHSDPVFQGVELPQEFLDAEIAEIHISGFGTYLSIDTVTFSIADEEENALVSVTLPGSEGALNFRFDGIFTKISATQCAACLSLTMSALGTSAPTARLNRATNIDLPAEIGMAMQAPGSATVDLHSLSFELKMPTA